MKRLHPDSQPFSNHQRLKREVHSENERIIDAKLSATPGGTNGGIMNIDFGIGLNMTGIDGTEKNPHSRRRMMPRAFRSFQGFKVNEPHRQQDRGHHGHNDEEEQNHHKNPGHEDSHRANLAHTEHQLDNINHHGHSGHHPKSE